MKAAFRCDVLRSGPCRLMRHRPLRAVAGLSESGLLDGRADLLIVGEGGGRPMAMPIPIAPLRIIPSRNGSQIVTPSPRHHDQPSGVVDRRLRVGRPVIAGQDHRSPTRRRRIRPRRLFPARPPARVGISGDLATRRSERITLGSSRCAASAASRCHSCTIRIAG